jgi:FkbM family methyltransferase
VSFVSYAQNYEDVMLARALANVERGFYIDVGAQDPRFDSVTKAFYDQGWHGINLEPVEHWHRRLQDERPRDINLCLAAGDHEGTIEFHETDESGLSTASAEFARRHRAQGHALRTRQVPVSTLDAICRAHDVREVHFLKVDVEGAEAEVLRGLDLARLRPWIILVEATEPNSRTSTHAQWESLVTDHDYRMAYQDGLNRYYLAREHEDLAPAFASPPNIFDDFVRRELVDLGTMLGERIAGLEAQVERVQALADARAAQLASDEAQLALLRSEREQASARIDELGATVEREHALSLRRLEEIAQLEARAVELEAELEAGAAAARKLAARLEGTEDTLASLAREFADARAEHHGTVEAFTRELDAHAATLAELGRAQADFQQVLSSRSWRITAPLRRATSLALLGRERLAGMLRNLARFRWARAMAGALLSPFPGIGQRVRRGLYGEPADADTGAAEGEVRAAQAPEPFPLTRDAQAIMARCPVRSRDDDGRGAG